MGTPPQYRRPSSCPGTRQRMKFRSRADKPSTDVSAPPPSAPSTSAPQPGGDSPCPPPQRPTPSTRSPSPPANSAKPPAPTRTLHQRRSRLPPLRRDRNPPPARLHRRAHHRPHQRLRHRNQTPPDRAPQPHPRQLHPPPPLGPRLPQPDQPTDQSRPDYPRSITRLPCDLSTAVLCPPSPNCARNVRCAVAFSFPSMPVVYSTAS